jgi:toxin CcdB
MAHLDIYRNPDPASSRLLPYVLDAQSDLLSDLPTRMVIPLARPEAIEALPILRLNPKVAVEGTPLIALTQDMAPVPRRLLQSPLGNLSSQRAEILAALDFLFTGY